MAFDSISESSWRSESTASISILAPSASGRPWWLVRSGSCSSSFWSGSRWRCGGKLVSGMRKAGMPASSRDLRAADTCSSPIQRVEQRGAGLMCASMTALATSIGCVIAALRQHHEDAVDYRGRGNGKDRVAVTLPALHRRRCRSGLACDHVGGRQALSFWTVSMFSCYQRDVEIPAPWSAAMAPGPPPLVMMAGAFLRAEFRSERL